MPEIALYSDILQNFARPLLSSKDTDKEFMSKMKVIEVIWNYSIAKKFRMPVYKELDKIITAQLKQQLEMKAVFDTFLQLKKSEYGQYNNYIIKVELRKSSDGIKTLYVESADPKHIK